MWLDPIVEEVRRIRDAHAQQFGYDLRAIYEDMKRFEREHNLEMVSFPPRPAISTQLGPRPAAPEVIYQVAEPAVGGELRQGNSEAERQVTITTDDQGGATS
jgi:hypothetical protein